MQTSRWTHMPERGSRLGMATLRAIFRIGGMRPLRIALAPVVLYYVLTDRAVRAASRDYLARLHHYCHNHGITPPIRSNLAGVYRHVYSFALSMAEKFQAWEGDGVVDLELDSPELSQRLTTGAGGALVLVSHLGNFDVAIAHAAFATTRSYRILIDFATTPGFNRERLEALEDRRVRFHDVGRFGPEVAIELKQAISDGEIVVIAADRLGRSDAATIPTTLLDAPARLPAGPWILAHLLGCPVYAVFACREKRAYRLIPRAIDSPVDLSDRSRRDETLGRLARQYTRILEQLVVCYPDQWYNFYHYWETDA